MQKISVRFLLIVSGIIILIFLLMQPLQVIHFKEYIAMLFPKGIIALEERNLLFIIQAIMLIVMIPVYILTFFFSWRYRAEKNNKAPYDPDLVDSHLAEYIWWGLPLVLTAVICVLTWIKTYELDPFRPLKSDKDPITIQVVALQWKWLFIYPQENIASVNFLQIPTKTPIRFEITADAPMNSFWIPHLGGQIYAMPNMKTVLNLMADVPGDFRGSSANISGEGFATMHFNTRASTEEEYKQWIQTVKQGSESLNFERFNQLAKPTQSHPVEFYKVSESDLFDKILMKYMHPQVK